MQELKINPIVVPIIILTAIFLTFAAWSAGTMNLSQYKWKNRLLLVFAPHNSHPTLSDLKNDISAQREEILERDLIVFEIYEIGPSYEDKTRIDPQKADAARRDFRVPSGSLTVILIGKDGGVKLRRDEPVDLRDIFLLIDAMPMRQEEMRRKSQ
jgi:hypothetical protein